MYQAEISAMKVVDLTSQWRQEVQYVINAAGAGMARQ